MTDNNSVLIDGEIVEADLIDLKKHLQQAQIILHNLQVHVEVAEMICKKKALATNGSQPEKKRRKRRTKLEIDQSTEGGTL